MNLCSNIVYTLENKNEKEIAILQIICVINKVVVVDCFMNNAFIQPSVNELSINIRYKQQKESLKVIIFLMIFYLSRSSFFFIKCC